MDAIKITIHTLLKRYHGPGLTIRWWDGSKNSYGDESPAVTVAIKDRSVMKHFLTDPIVVFGEGYTNGLIDVEGDIRDLIAIASRLETLNTFPAKLRKKLYSIAKKISPTGIKQQQKDISHHYDTGNKFFSLWLDKTLTYSCGYFKHKNDTLEQAQHNKNDYVLKKAMLKPGETMLDIGSGWGDLILLATKKYRVKSFGIALAQEQVKKTRERIKQAKLEHRAEARYLDYRELPTLKKTFDKIVSVGMFEHVGQANIPLFFGVIKKVLKPGGIMVLHTIGRIEEAPINPWIQKYIFPGGYLPKVQEILDQLVLHDFRLLDIENLRIHYAKTLDIWAENFDKHFDEVVNMYDGRFARMWRLYLYGCAASFRYLGAQIYQIVFTNGLRNDLPLTREYLYKN